MTDGTWNRKGLFEFPENCVDLIDLFLSPPVRRARWRVNRRIERSNMTPMAQQVAKAVTTIEAITVQGRQDRRQKRQVNQR